VGPLITEKVALIPEGSSIGQTLVWATALLKSGGVDTPRLDAECLLASLLRSNRLHLYAAIEEDQRQTMLPLPRQPQPGSPI